jgi:arsenate reductase (thioredoxin)
MKKMILKTSVVLLSLVVLTTTVNAEKFYKKLQKYAEGVEKEYGQILEPRKEPLNEIVVQILTDLKKYDVVQPIFICTHNSRRSHMAQLWLNTAAGFYGIDAIKPYSGGTDVTAFNKNAVAALQRAGFSFTETEHEGQKAYIVKATSGSSERLMFSKKYDDIINPKRNFFAVMVCSEADESCPVISGADNRISLPYDDPRYFDGTPSVDVKYDETCRLIAREMFYIMSEVKKQLNLEAETKKK